jgi:membrane protein
MYVSAAGFFSPPPQQMRQLPACTQFLLAGSFTFYVNLESWTVCNVLWRPLNPNLTAGTTAVDPTNALFDLTDLPMPDVENLSSPIAGRTVPQDAPAPALPDQPGVDTPKGGAPAPDAVRKEKVNASPAAREAGRYARAPHEIPPKGWWTVAKRAGAGFIQDRIMAEAASVTFYVLLALFPALAAFISIYGLFTNPASVGAQLASIGSFVPGGGMDIIQGQITALTSKSGGTLGFAAITCLLVSLWSANNGIKSLIGALNVVYHEHEKRSYVKLTLVAFAFTMGTIVFGILALFTVVAIPILLKFVGLGFATAILISLLRWPLMLAVLAVMLAIIYRYGPSRNWARWGWVSWGGGAAAIFWVLVSLAFSFYVANFANYNKTYGSLGAVIGFMTWIWISTIIVLMGAELNAELEQQTEMDSTIGPEKPPGERGAFKADVKA